MQKKIHKYMELRMMNESMNSVLQEDLINNAKIINE